MKRLFITMLLIFAVHALQAQVPGYVGRKNIIHADFNFFPKLGDNHFRPNNYSGNTGFLFNTSWGAGYERVVSRRHLLGVDFFQTRTGNGYTTFRQQEGRVAIDAIGIGFHFKAFPFLSQGRLAPIGPYVEFSYKLILVSSMFFPFADPSHSMPHAKHLGGGSALTLGGNYLIKGRIMPDVGFQFALTDIIGNLSSNYKVSEDAYRLLGTNIVMVHFGLGFLF